MSTPLEWALWYAGRGLPVIPVWPLRDGRCACGQGACKPGKHPVGHLVPAGSIDATVNPDTVRQWWTAVPDANVAVVTGPSPGGQRMLIAVDVDPRHAGDASLEEWERQRPEGPLPPTWRQRTGGGGFHLLFWAPLADVKNRVNWLPGVDVKVRHGYVLVPPSNHASGGRYSWDVDFESLPEPAECPRDLLADLQQRETQAAAASGLPGALAATGDILRGVPEGQRNDTLFRFACRLFRQLGLGARPAVETLVLKAAAESQPPFPEDEAQACVDSAARQDYSDPEWLAAAGLVAAWAQGLGDTPDEQLFPLTDDGNAWRYVRDWGRETLYVDAWGWLHWTGQKWQRDEHQLARRRALETVHKIADEAALTDDDQQRQQVRRWALKSQGASQTDGLLKQLKPKLARSPGDFDADSWLLNCQNGVLDLRTGELAPHSRDRYFTKACSAQWDPAAECPRWLEFLERVVPDPEVREFLRRAVGYSLTGSTREKVMFILHGSGANGKTVFVETLRAVLGDYALSTPAATLVNRRPEQLSNDIARLRGARFVTAQETQAGAQLAVELVKELTGGDRVTARFMRQEFFEFTPELKLWLSTNHFPVVNDFGDAIWGRLRLVPFGVAIPRGEQVPRDQLEGRLLAEASGILRWAAEGCRAWERERTLTEPAAVVLAVAEQRQEMDWFEDFLEECCERGEAGWFESSKRLYERYRGWAVERGERSPWTINSFSRELAKRGLQRARGPRGEKGFLGVRLKEGTFVVPPAWS